MASPMARLQQKKQAAVTTGSAKSTGIPCAMVLTVSFELSPVTMLGCHRRSSDSLRPATLAPASERQDHTTSPSACATFVSRAIRVHRIPAPRVVTIGRNVPLHRGGMAESIVVICPTEQARKHAADWHDGQFGYGVYVGFACRARASSPISLTVPQGNVIALGSKVTLWRRPNDFRSSPKGRHSY
jgi:hypothetical protein